MDFFYWGGPAYCDTATKVPWARETKVFCNPLNGMDNSAYYDSLGPEPKLDALLKRAKLDPAQVQSIGIGGFSAFHSFGNRLLKNDADRARINYVHLADSCFLGAGATNPHLGYVAFAKEAAAGDKLMVTTTNGPWDKDISYTGPDGTFYHLTSGAQCFRLVWTAATGSAEGGEDAPTPIGIPAPTWARRVGNLYWYHYENDMRPGKNDNHAWHSNVLAQPLMTQFGVPWMAGIREGDGGGGIVSGAPKKLPPWFLGGAAGALGYWLAQKWMNRNK